MAGKQRTKTLGEVCSTITDGAHQSPKTVQSGMPMASVKDLNFWGLDLDTARHISHEDYLALVRQGCQPLVGDVLIAKDGNSALDTVCVIEEPMDVVLLSSIAILRPDSSQIESKYLKYYFMSPNVIDYLKSNFISGAAIPRVILRDFKRAAITLPDLDEQRAIAHILGTLDDKIELNRRRNQTLETMARALFKDWFVDFGPVRAKMEGREPYLTAETWELFPTRLDDEGKPEGWTMATLDSLAQLMTTSVSPGKSPETIFEHYSIPAFDAGRMPAMERGESIKSNKYIVDCDAVLVSKLNPQTPRIWMPFVTTDNAICSTEFMQFVPHDRANRPYLYCLMSSQAMQEEVLRHVTGSTGSRQRAQPSQIAKVHIMEPHVDILKAFNQKAAPILDAVADNQRESCTLAELRDTLLPKLISSELRITDAERFLETRA
jgi:type I restriction enzyme S subunit